MTTYKQTFRLTPQRRPWYRRLTPVAWLLIGVGAVLAAVLLAGMFNKFKGERDTPLVLPAARPSSEERPSPTTAPVATPVPTEAPAPEQDQEEVLAFASEPDQGETPASAVEGDQGEAPGSTIEQDQEEALMPPAEQGQGETTAGGQVWWADLMVCNEQGECLPPEEAAREIIAAFWEWREAIPFYYSELDMTPEQLEYYYTGEILRLQLEFVALVEETGAMWEGETIVKEYDYETRVPHVVTCTPDGLTCLLGETVQGNLTIHEYDLTTRQVVNAVHNPPGHYGGVNIWRFQYDEEAGKWKVERYYQWVPAPAP